MSLLTADDLCKAAETTLRDHLPALAAARGLDPVVEWKQVPTPDALSTANTPAMAITSPGLTEPPARRSGTVDATWRIVIGVYDRGDDYGDTAARTRKWAAVVRQVILQHPTLGGVANGVAWVGEEYAERPERSSARTLGGCAVAFDVSARDVIDTKPYTDPATADPTVTSTHRTVTIRPLNQE